MAINSPFGDKRPVFIVDSLNTFLRSYAVYPTMSAEGHQMGGCVGFLKTLRRLCREFQPKAVYLAWEGGGSQRRRSLFSGYKNSRRPDKLNRFYEDDIPDTDQNKHDQMLKLVGFLKHVPVCQLYASDCEADDVVAYLCRGPLKHESKVIVSADKDMYQLLDDDTFMYSLYRKRFVTQEDVMQEYRISTKNFAYAKALCGDPSDNIPGLKGLGFKTVAKRFPMLGSLDDFTLQDVLDFASAHRDESAVYKRVVESADLVKRNWQLVFLDGSMLSANQTQKIDFAVNTFTPRANKVGLIKAMIKEGVNDFDTSGFFYDLNSIENVKYI